MTDALVGARIPSPLGGRAAHRRLGELARETEDREDLFALLRIAVAGRDVACRFEDARECALYRSLVRAIEAKIVRDGHNVWGLDPRPLP